MKAAICPVCSGLGRIPVSSMPNPDYTSVFPPDKTCHGCSGKGWVAVPDDYYGPYGGNLCESPRKP